MRCLHKPSLLPVKTGKPAASETVSNEILKIQTSNRNALTTRQTGQIVEFRRTGDWRTNLMSASRGPPGPRPPRARPSLSMHRVTNSPLTRPRGPRTTCSTNSRKTQTEMLSARTMMTFGTSQTLWWPKSRRTRRRTSRCQSLILKMTRQ